MISSFDKFKILIWKNWTIQKRNWKGGLFEILLPFLLVLAFTYSKKSFFEKMGKDEGTLQFTKDKVPNPSKCPLNNFASSNRVLYSPTSPWLTSMVNTSLKDVKGLEIQSFPNRSLLNDFLDKNKDSAIKPLFAIEFEDDLSVSIDHLSNTTDNNFNMS